MKIRLLYTLLVAALVATAAVALTGLPANAETKTIMVRLDTGQLVPVQVEVDPGTALEDIQIPTVPGVTEPDEEPAPTETVPAPTPTEPDAPESTDQEEQEPSRSRDRAEKDDEVDEETELDPADEVEGPRDRKRKRGTDLRKPDGSPTRSNPTFFDALPGPSRVTGVPNFVIRKFQVPIFLLSIYQAAGIQYGVHWQVLAAINEIETDYGRNLNVSSAGALGWMQFLPSTWRAYGVDANKDGKKDPYNPVDAIFAAARYLKAAGYEQNVRRAIFAYNHADWYVDSVLLRATRIKQMPDDLVSSLTGLTEARFPVAARARYADDLSELEAERRFQRGENAANLVEDSVTRRGIDIFAREGSPVVAVNDGVIKKIGKNRRLGRHVVLQDVYGNRFTYARLGSVSSSYPVPKEDATDPKQRAEAIPANDQKPTRPASAGRQLDTSDTVGKGKRARADAEPAPRPTIPLKERLFAHPSRPNSRVAGGDDQILGAKGSLKGYTTFRNYFSRAFGLNAKDVRLKTLREGSRVIGGTILGRIGRTVEGKAAHTYFEIRPVGRGAPRIDPKPILDGWKLLEATAIYRAAGKNALYGDDGTTVGQVLLLPKPLLEKRVLADERIEIYPCGRQDIQSGQIDRRVLATLAVLAERGFRSTVTSLKCGHSFYTSSGNVSHHSSGNAVDIAQVNGIPILGHQEPGGITDQTINVLLQLQGTLQPDQIISLIEKGGPTYAMGDHADHIHVGFRPLFGVNRKQGLQSLAVLKPGQWDDLLARLREIDNPTVPTETSKFAIPVKKHRGSDAHQGE